MVILHERMLSRLGATSAAVEVVRGRAASSGVLVSGSSVVRLAAVVGPLLARRLTGGRADGGLLLVGCADSRCDSAAVGFSFVVEIGDAGDGIDDRQVGRLPGLVREFGWFDSDGDYDDWSARCGILRRARA